MRPLIFYDTVFYQLCIQCFITCNYLPNPLHNVFGTQNFSKDWVRDSVRQFLKMALFAQFFYGFSIHQYYYFGMVSSQQQKSSARSEERSASLLSVLGWLVGRLINPSRQVYLLMTPFKWDDDDDYDVMMILSIISWTASFTLLFSCTSNQGIRKNERISTTRVHYRRPSPLILVDNVSKNRITESTLILFFLYSVQSVFCNCEISFCRFVRHLVTKFYVMSLTHLFGNSIKVSPQHWNLSFNQTTICMVLFIKIYFSNEWFP